MSKKILVVAAIALLAACKAEDRTGTPETDTTATNAQSAQETSTATATTTGVNGGTLTAMTDADKEFVSKAGMGGLAEVQMGNLALQKAASADVKAFGQRMVTDHSAANAELAQLATAKGVSLPAELSGEHKEAYDPSPSRHATKRPLLSRTLRWRRRFLR